MTNYNHHMGVRTIPKLISLAAIVVCLAWTAVGTPACWNVVGHRLEMTSEQLAEAASDAPERGDDTAARTLLGRLIEDHPESAEARWARRLLQELDLGDQGSPALDR
jgi:hypothetical protein